MPDNAIPNNAHDWAQLLAGKKLPSPFRVGPIVLRQLDEGILPYNKLADTINSDPILAYTVMSLANQRRIKETEGSKTVSQAISMIGVDQLEATVKDLPFQSSSSTDIKSFYYIRCMSTSLYAAHLGQALSQHKNKGKPKDYYWASLFLGTPLWLLWRFATPEMRLIRYAIRSNFKLPKVAENEVLGDTLLNVTTAISKQLFLPDLANECFLRKNQLSTKQWVQLAKATPETGHPNPIEDRDLLMAMQSPHFPVMLANLVAHFATYDWYSKATLRSQKILATYLNITLDDAIKLTHEVAADMSRTHPLPTVMLPAAKLMIPPRKRTKVPNQSPAQKAEEASASTQKLPKKEIQEATSAESSKPVDNENKPNTQQIAADNNPLFNELTEIMLHRPDEFADLHELMNAATQGIAYGINLKRATGS